MTVHLPAVSPGLSTYPAASTCALILFLLAESEQEEYRGSSNSHLSPALLLQAIQFAVLKKRVAVFCSNPALITALLQELSRQDCFAFTSFLPIQPL